MLPPLKKVKIKKKTPTFHNGTHNAMYKNRYFLFKNNEKLSTVKPEIFIEFLEFFSHFQPISIISVLVFILTVLIKLILFKF